MQRAAEDLDFERAIELRDQLGELSNKLGDAKPKKTRAKKAPAEKKKK